MYFHYQLERQFLLFHKHLEIQIIYYSRRRIIARKSVQLSGVWYYQERAFIRIVLLSGVCYYLERAIIRKRADDNKFQFLKKLTCFFFMANDDMNKLLLFTKSYSRVGHNDWFMSLVIDTTEMKTQIMI